MADSIFQPGDLVQVTKVPEWRGKEFREEEGNSFLIKSVSSPIWFHNIYLTYDPFLSPNKHEFDNLVMEKKAWAADELTLVTRKETLLKETHPLLFELSSYTPLQVVERLEKLTRHSSEDNHLLRQFRRYLSNARMQKKINKHS